MLMRLFNSIDLIGCGGDINQSESCSSVHKVRKAHKVCKVHKAYKAGKACKAHKAHKVVWKKSGFYVNEVVQFH